MDSVSGGGLWGRLKDPMLKEMSAREMLVLGSGSGSVSLVVLGKRAGMSFVERGVTLMMMMMMMITRVVHRRQCHNMAIESQPYQMGKVQAFAMRK